MAEKTVKLKIKRQTGPTAESHWDEFEIPWKPGMNVISAMMDIAANPVTKDGKQTTPIAYDSNCLEEICGSCAMLINGKAKMACSALVDHFEQPITVEPLSKFPIVRDLAVDLKPDDIPFQPWAKALFDERKDGSHSRDDNAAHCLPPGVPRINAAPFPWKIVQTPGFIVIAYETFNFWRQVFLDGRELAEDAPPAWFGYSTGKWDGDTLVVDTKGFNGKAWIDQLGNRRMLSM